MPKERQNKMARMMNPRMDVRSNTPFRGARPYIRAHAPLSEAPTLYLSADESVENVVLR